MGVFLTQYLGFFERLFADDPLMGVLDIVLQTFSMVDFSLCGEKVRGVVFLQTGIPCVAFIGEQVLNAGCRPARSLPGFDSFFVESAGDGQDAIA